MTTDILLASRQSKKFHGTVSRRAYAAHAFGRITLKPLLSVFPLFPSTARALDFLDDSIQHIPFPRSFTKEVVKTPTWNALLLTPAHVATKSKVIVYLHGGAFFSCGLGTHRPIFQALAAANELPVFAVDYRQYPKALFDDTVKDCHEAINYLLSTGYKPEDIILAGDSAGGGLAIRLAGDLMDEGKVVAGVVSLSGWLDFTATREDYHRWASRDAYIPVRRILGVVQKVLGRIPTAQDSPISSLKDGFPPLLLVCGANELLRFDSEKAWTICEEKDIICDLHYFRGGAHAFPVASGLFPEGLAALEEVRSFVENITTH